MRRLVHCALLALAAAGALVGVAPATVAQDYYYRRYYDDGPPPDRVIRRRGDWAEDGGYYDRAPRRVRRDAQPAPQAAPETRRSGIGGFFQRLFGQTPDDDRDSGGWTGRRDPGAVEVRPPPRPVRRKPKGPAPLPPAMVASPDAPAGAPPVAAKSAPTAFAAVFGDVIAEELAGGLEQAFADQPELAVRRHVKPNGGLVRADYFDLVEEAKKAVSSEEITYAVIDVGVNDRQPFLDARDAKPLSPAWTARYGERVDALLAPFKARKIPVYWVGLAPSESEAASDDHTALNALIKERVEAAGGTYVDVWDGFVDEDGEYEAEGPQLDGQVGPLRLDDGVRFTEAGARKLAHYVEREIRKVYTPKGPSADAIAGAVAPEGDPQSAALGPGAARPRPIASPLVVLTAPRRAENGALAASAAAIPARDASPDAERVLVNGEAPVAEPGRLDDHRWPAAEPAAQAEPSRRP